jgi:hypothetical protein
MKFRGEFIRSDGLVIPNNVTVFGRATLLAAALRNTVPTFYVGLVDASPDPELLIADCVEPAIGTHGYARIQITRDDAGWPGSGTLNGQPYLESDWMIWEATGGAFDQAVQRLMLVSNATNIAMDVSDANLKVIALSAAMPLLLTVDVATLEADRKFKYRLYA